MVWLNNKLVRALAKHSARPDMFYVSRRQRFGFHARGESRAVGAGHAMSVLLAHRSERTVTLACQRSGLVYQGHSLSALRPSPPLSTPPRARRSEERRVGKACMVWVSASPAISQERD